jgi:hypothetical protein
MPDTNDDRLPDEEVARRRDEALRRSLNTPPKPRKPKAEKKGGPRKERPGSEKERD